MIRYGCRRLLPYSWGVSVIDVSETFIFLKILFSLKKKPDVESVGTDGLKGRDLILLIQDVREKKNGG
jgi:hypothetical protein